MPQSKERHAEYMREKRREEAPTLVPTGEKLVHKNAIMGSQSEGSQYPAILLALTDPIKRRKLEKITESLKNHNQLKNVYYGYPDKGIPFDLVGDLLEATRN